MLYAALIAAVGAVMAYALATRGDFGLSVQHDRNPLFVRLSDGRIRNAYTIRVLNKELVERPFLLSVEGLESPDVEIAGERGRRFSVEPDRTRELRVLVTERRLEGSTSRPIWLRITTGSGDASAVAVDRFDAL
jgi:polyferredoxin